MLRLVRNRKIQGLVLGAALAVSVGAPGASSVSAQYFYGPTYGVGYSYGYGIPYSYSTSYYGS